MLININIKQKNNSRTKNIIKLIKESILVEGVMNKSNEIKKCTIETI